MKNSCELKVPEKTGRMEKRIYSIIGHASRQSEHSGL